MSLTAISRRHGVVLLHELLPRVRWNEVLDASFGVIENSFVEAWSDLDISPQTILRRGHSLAHITGNRAALPSGELRDGCVLDSSYTYTRLLNLFSAEAECS
jgi:hypothetical protein